MSRRFKTNLSVFVLSTLTATPLFAAQAAADPGIIGKARTLGELFMSGGISMIFLVLLSIVAGTFVVYHFMNIKMEKLVPQDLLENLLSLLEKKEYQKAKTVCQQQPNLVSAVTLKGIEKVAKNKGQVEEAIQAEGKAELEKLWQNLTYLSDIAILAPLLGLLGTIFGMIDAFNYFKAGTINPVVLTQGLAKAMINTAFGLVIAVPAMAFYSYFRGKLSAITSAAERAASEITHALVK